MDTGENKVTIVRAGALRPLIILLGVANSDIQCSACGCITTLATIGGCGCGCGGGGHVGLCVYVCSH